MFYNYNTPFDYNPRPLLSPQQTTLPSIFHQSSTTFFNSNHFPFTNTLFDSHNTFLLSPNHSAYNSRQNEVGVSQSTFSYRQPITNPHTHLLNRSIDNCPQGLTGSKRTKWLKAGLKAKNNHELTSTLPRFQWPTSFYDVPVHIHHRTPESIIRGLLFKLSNVRIYMIDTESDRPTRQTPHSLPALIQIQAIHHETYSTVLLIEVQHLPHISTSLFSLIQRLCDMIFSPLNKIIAWGEIDKELNPFVQFNLFDISKITNILNLQDYFTNQWNLNHPHTSDCVARHQPAVDDPSSDDVLICLVNSDDLDDEYNEVHPINDFNTCICPDDIRPYKHQNDVWSLQKAIQFTFQEALDKSLTFNFWSGGLDVSLQTGRTTFDRQNRISLIDYAIYDLFAPTALYFHIERTKVSPNTPTHSIQLNTLHSSALREIPTFLVITDSHGKFLPPVTVQTTYTFHIKAISGLQWVNPYNTRLCCKSLLITSNFSSLLSNCRGVLFIVGSNSTRTTYASTILLQIEEIIDVIRSNHPHLTNNTSICISNTFPCYKSSSLFYTNSLLLSNINIYNEGLQALSLRKQFSTVHFPISDEHVGPDGLHIRIEYLSIIYENIKHYFNTIFPLQSTKSHSKRRSKEALKRRNHLRHNKLKIKQKQYTLIRSIARVWPLTDLKQYLKNKNIHYSRLSEIYHHQLKIQFNNSLHLQHAEQTLTDTDFDESNYYNWISQQQN